jgi:hypothetical protein
MRICGKQLVVLALLPLALAGCGGTEDNANGTVGGNLPPVIAGTPPTSLQAGTAYSFTPTAADPDGDTLSFNVTNKPAWATFDAQTGALTGTPAESDVGMTSMITIEVSDSKAVAELPGFRIAVSSAAQAPPPANSAPTIAGTPGGTATVARSYSFMPTGADADGDTLTYSIQNKPAWATFTAATGQLAGTPISANVGTYSNIIITVSDGTAQASLAPFSVQVVSSAPANRAPTISGTPAATVTAGTAYTFTPVGSDADGNTLTYSIQNQPSWAQFSTTTGRLSGTPTSANVGTTARITISVTDGTASASLPSFTIQVVAAANRAPTISGSPLLSILAGVSYSFQPSASDPDGDALTFSIQNRPSWATFSTSTGRLSGTPGLLDIALFSNITISVSDGSHVVSLPAFSLSVLNNGSGSATVSWTPPTTNTDGSQLTDLARFRVVYGQAQANLDQSIDVADAAATSQVVSNLTSGTWYFAVVAVNDAGVESDASNVATKTIQ